MPTLKFPVKSKDAIFEAPVAVRVAVETFPADTDVDAKEVADIDVEVRPAVVVVAKDVLPDTVSPPVEVKDVDVMFVAETLASVDGPFAINE